MKEKIIEIIFFFDDLQATRRLKKSTQTSHILIIAFVYALVPYITRNLH